MTGLTGDQVDDLVARVVAHGLCPFAAAVLCTRVKP